jgi:chromosome segregation ATPase
MRQGGEYDTHRLDSQVESLRVALERSARAHRKSDQRVSELTREKSILLIEVGALEKRAAELTSQLSAQETLARSLAKATESNRQLSDKLRKRSAQAKDLKITVRRLADKCESLVAQQAEQERTAIELAQEQARLGQANRRLEDEISGLHGQLATQRESQRQMRAEASKWKAEALMAKQQLRDLQQTQRELRQTHSDLDEKQASALRQITELTDQNRRMECQKNDAQSEITELQAELFEIQRKLRQVSSEKAEAEARADCLSDELRVRDRHPELEELRRDNAELVTIIAQARNGLTQSHSRLERDRRERALPSLKSEDGELSDDSL